MGLIATSVAKEIILSAGVDNLSRQELDVQYTTYKAYAELGLITTASILTYGLGDDGLLEIYPTSNPDYSAEDYQRSLKGDLSLKLSPVYIVTPLWEFVVIYRPGWRNCILKNLFLFPTV